MPNFHFTEEEIEAVTMAVLSFNTDKVGEPLLAHNKVPDYNKAVSYTHLTLPTS